MELVSALSFCAQTAGGLLECLAQLFPIMGAFIVNEDFREADVASNHFLRQVDRSFDIEAHMDLDLSRFGDQNDSDIPLDGAFAFKRDNDAPAFFECSDWNELPGQWFAHGIESAVQNEATSRLNRWARAHHPSGPSPKIALNLLPLSQRQTDFVIGRRSAKNQRRKPAFVVEQPEGVMFLFVGPPP